MAPVAAPIRPPTLLLPPLLLLLPPDEEEEEADREAETDSAPDLTCRLHISKAIRTVEANLLPPAWNNFVTPFVRNRMTLLLIRLPQLPRAARRFEIGIFPSFRNYNRPVGSLFG